MNHPIWKFFIACLGAICVGCDKPDQEEVSYIIERDPIKIANDLPGAPSTLLRHAVDSPIHWQRWEPDLLEKAISSERLIFAVVASLRYTGYIETMEAMERDPAVVERLNKEFIPVLVDLDFCRESALISAALCLELDQPIMFPFLLVLSPRGDPILWQAINQHDADSVDEFFDNAMDVVSRQFREDQEYVIGDSAEKAEIRMNRLPKPYPMVKDKDIVFQEYQGTIRRLTSLYDSYIQGLAGGGGLVPIGTFECLHLANNHPLLSEDLRNRCDITIEGLLDNILSSAMIDPLDGGIYHARNGKTWDLPVFIRDCETQGRMVRVLAQLSKMNPKLDHLSVAQDAIRFAERRYRLPNGLFSLVAIPESIDDKDWLWTISQVREELNEEEFAVWSSLSQLSELGNIPPETQMVRNYFRLNSLAKRSSISEVSDATGYDDIKIEKLVESGRKKLLKARNQRFSGNEPHLTPSATASFRMVSAYASMYTATGERTWRDQAVALGNKCKSAFGENRYLTQTPGNSPGAMFDGRAINYTIAIQAALDLASITLDQEWAAWAQDLSSIMAESFVTEEGRLLETRSESSVITIPYEDRKMIFGDSTIGLIRMGLSRLEAMGYRTPPPLRPWRDQLPPVYGNPLIFTDTICEMGMQLSRKVVLIGPDAPEAILEATRQLPLTLYERQMNRNMGEETLIIDVDGKKTPVNSASELEVLRSFH